MAVDLLVFPAVTMLLFCGFQFLSRFSFRNTTHLRRRIAAEFGKQSQPRSFVALYKNLDKVDLGEPLVPNLQQWSGAARIRALAHLRERLEILLNQAQLPLNVRQLFQVAGGSAVGLGCLGACFGGFPLGISGWLVGLAAPFILVHIKHRVRRDRFLKQLPKAFELMARVIQSGQSVPQALQSVSEAFEDPIAREFASCQHQQDLGMLPEDTYHQMAERSGILELRIFVMAMLIQRQTGGSLSEVLDRLAGLLRARLRLRQQLRTLTAEGRLQGLTLVVLPFIMFGVMMVINRQYANVLLDHIPLVLATLGWMAIGVLWIRRIVTFKI
jgi:tight adherence protein B